MKKYIIYIIVLMIRVSSAGEYTADFLNIGVGAKPVAMGNAFTALANDASAVYWNPAGIVQTRTLDLHLDHAPMFNGLAQYNVVGANLKLDSNMALGVCWIGMGIDEIPRYSALQGTRLDRLTTGDGRSTGEAEGYFADSENAVLVSIARKMHFDFMFGPGFNKAKIALDLSLGLSYKYLHQKLDANYGNGQALDLGMWGEFPAIYDPAGQAFAWFRFGLAAKNIAQTNLVWDTDSQHEDALPQDWVLGAASEYWLRRLNIRATLAVDYVLAPFQEWHVGGELLFFDLVALRAGTHRQNLAAGAGLVFKGFQIDYAFVTHTLANTHRISGAFHF